MRGSFLGGRSGGRGLAGWLAGGVLGCRDPGGDGAGGAEPNGRFLARRAVTASIVTADRVATVDARAEGAEQNAAVATLTYPEALVATVVIEVPVWATLLVATHGITWRRAAGIGLLVNVVSHPVFWFVAYPAVAAGLGADHPWVALALSEALVVVAEAALAALCLGDTRADGDAVTRQPWLLVAIALAANLLSVAIGILLQQ